MKIPSSLPRLGGIRLFAFLAVVSVGVAHADQPTGQLECQAADLTPLRTDLPPGLALDFEAAQGSPLRASVSRDYDFPSSDVRVSIQLRYLGTRVEVSQTYFKRVGSSVQLMMTFASPFSLDFPLIPGAQYVLKSSGGSGVPAHEMNCKLTLAK